MKLTFNGSIAIVRPFGFLEVNMVPLKLSEKHISQISSRNVDAILLSLKNVTFFSPLWLSGAIENLSEEAQKLGITLAICDYNDIFYELMIKTVKNILNISLFESELIADLFLNKFISETNSQVLVYNPTEQYRHYLAEYLKDRTYDVVEAKDINEFNSKKSSFTCVVSPLNHVKLSQKRIDTFIKGGIVIYSVRGFIDSDFVENFDLETHNIMLRIGYKFFILWVNIACALNIRGANFLINLANTAQKNGAFISLCGVNEANLSNELTTNLKGSNILIYKNLYDFYKDNSVLYLEKRTFDIEPANISKAATQISPYVIQCVSKTISSLVEQDTLCVDTKAGTFDIEDECEFLRVCVQFYGDIDMRILFGLKKQRLDKICSIFMSDEDDLDGYLSGYSQIFSIITNKILAQLWQKEIEVKVSLPKFLTDEMFFDRSSVGIITRLNVKDGETGFIFISK